MQVTLHDLARCFYRTATIHPACVVRPMPRAGILLTRKGRLSTNTERPVTIRRNDKKQLSVGVRSLG
jgi:hypothetical protein